MATYRDNESGELVEAEPFDPVGKHTRESFPNLMAGVIAVVPEYEGEYWGTANCDYRFSYQDSELKNIYSGEFLILDLDNNIIESYLPDDFLERFTLVD